MNRFDRTVCSKELIEQMNEQILQNSLQQRMDSTNELTDLMSSLQQKNYRIKEGTDLVEQFVAKNQQNRRMNRIDRTVYITELTAQMNQQV